MASMVWFLRRSRAGRLGEVVDFAIDAGAEALLVELVEEIFELALAAAHDGRHDGDAFARPSSRTRWTIWSAVWRAMGRPQLGQWGVPMEA
jgi:hypothetical protein